MFTVTVHTAYTQHIDNALTEVAKAESWDYDSAFAFAQSVVRECLKGNGPHPNYEFHSFFLITVDDNNSSNIVEETFLIRKDWTATSWTIETIAKDYSPCEHGLSADLCMGSNHYDSDF